MLRTALAALAMYAAAPASAGAQAVPPAGGAAPRATASDEGGSHEVDRADIQESLRSGSFRIDADGAARMAMASDPSITSASAGLAQRQAITSRSRVRLYPHVELWGQHARNSVHNDFDDIFGLNDPVRQQQALEACLAAGGSVESCTGGVTTQTLRQFAGSLSDLAADYLERRRIVWAFRAEMNYKVSDLFLSLLPAVRANEAFAESEAYRVEVEKRRVALQAREAYYFYVRAKAALALVEVSHRQAQEHAQDISGRVESGLLPPGDLVQARADVTSTRLAVTRAQGQRELARNELLARIHKNVQGELAVAENIGQPVAEVREPLGELINQAIQRRPELQVLRKVVAAHGHDETAARGDVWPDFSVGGGVDYANPRPRTFPNPDKFGFAWDVSAVVKWVPNETADAIHRAQEAAASGRQAAADLQVLTENLRLEVRQAYVDYSSAMEAVAAGRVNVEAARERRRVNEDQFESGQVRAIEYLDAELDLRRAEFELIHAAVDVRIARVRLDHATGQPEAKRYANVSR